MELRITRDEYRADPRRFYDAVLADPLLRVSVCDGDAVTMVFESCPPDVLAAGSPRGVLFGGFCGGEEGCDACA